MGQPVKKDGSVETITMVIFANKFEDCPIVQRIGDIIRVHRATVSQYQGTKMLTARVYFNSSWVLFSPLIPVAGTKSLGFLSDEEDSDDQKKEFRPMAYFGKNFSPVDPHEQYLIRQLRLSLQKLSSSLKFIDTSKITMLSDISQTEYFEYDLIVRVLHIFKSEDEQKSEVSFIDQSGEIWQAEIYTGKFRWLREGQIVKVKGASKYRQCDGSRRLFMKFSTNVLTIPNDMKVAEGLIELDLSEAFA